MSDQAQDDEFIADLVAPNAESVLVIDDDPLIRDMVVLKLEQAGYQVFSAQSADHALDLIGKFGLPHLAIVDIHMPGRSGLDFCAEVNQYATSQFDTLQHSLRQASEEIRSELRDNADQLADAKMVSRCATRSVQSALGGACAPGSAASLKRN